MEIYEQCHTASYLKGYFGDFIVTYLDEYFINGVQTCNPQNEVEERALTFFVKTVSCMKSINTLFSQGDIVSARILMRSLFEVIVLLKKINKDRDDFVRYSKAYGKFKIIDTCKINIQLYQTDDTEKFYTEEELQDKIVQLQSEITTLGFLPTWNQTNGRPHVDKYFEIKEMAIDVEMEYLYNTVYKNLCLDTHTSSSHFYKYIYKTENGESLLNLHPYLHELDLMIYTITSIFMDFFECIEELLGISAECLANLQFRKLLHITASLLPKFLEQGLFKKAGIVAPIF